MKKETPYLDTSLLMSKWIAIDDIEFFFKPVEIEFQKISVAIGLAIVKKRDSRWFVDIYHNNSGTQEMGGQGRQLPTHILAGLLTLSQAKGADCAPHITTCPPCFG